MRDEIERALAPLVGRPLRAAARAADVLRLEFGVATPGAVSDGAGADALALYVACPWRLADGDRVLVGSGDLFTPADPDGDPETFDWEPEGASWLDVRLRELAEKREHAEPAVEGVDADAFGGVRLALAGGLAIELFPNSTPTGHVSTEFWRLSRPNGDDADFVVGTFGVDREPRT
jgi:hypothetical protein